MPVYACIAANAKILWSRDPELDAVMHTGSGSYILQFTPGSDTAEDVFVFSAKTAGAGCDAPLVVAAAVQDGPTRICMSVHNLAQLGAREDAQLSYIRYRRADET